MRYYPDNEARIAREQYHTEVDGPCYGDRGKTWNVQANDRHGKFRYTLAETPDMHVGCWLAARQNFMTTGSAEDFSFMLAMVASVEDPSWFDRVVPFTQQSVTDAEAEIDKGTRLVRWLMH